MSIVGIVAMINENTVDYIVLLSARKAPTVRVKLGKTLKLLERYYYKELI